MKKQKNILVVILLTLALVACGTGNFRETSVKNDSANYNPGEIASDSMKTEDKAEEATIDDGQSLDLTNNDRKIERFYDYSVETTDFDKDYQSIENLVGKYGGFFESSTIDREFPNETGDSLRILNATIKIPNEKSDDFRKELESHGKILSSSNHINDFTKSYADTSIRLKSKETELDKLNELLEKAENLEDVMAIQARILDVQAEIDQIKAAISDMDSRVYYDTYNLYLREVYDYNNVANRSPDFSGRIAQAFGDSIHIFINFFQDLILVLLTLWPLILIAILIVIFIKYRKKKKLSRINDSNKSKIESKVINDEK